MRHKSEDTAFARPGVSEHKSPIGSEPLRAPENEEWTWMVDEDPAFYLTKSGGVEAAGA